MRADGRTDRQTVDMTKLITAFRNVADPPLKNKTVSISLYTAYLRSTHIQ